MTGYGKNSKIVNDKKVAVEIKSLNSKNFNSYIKIPDEFNDKELEIRNMIFNTLSGGKISFSLTVEHENIHKNILNKELINSYLSELKEIAKEHSLKQENENLILAALKLPDVFQNEKKEINKEEWSDILECIKLTINDLDDFRVQEGNSLEKDILDKVKNIEKLIPSIEKYENERIETTANRIKSKLNDFFKEEESKERFEQEIIYYLDKFDLNEEKTRLKNHCKYFYETVKLNEPSGTKLGFIAQEMGREINTIGSKANHTEIQKIVVNMKDNLGKIKEQLLNVL